MPRVFAEVLGWLTMHSQDHPPITARNKVIDFYDSSGRFPCLAASLRIRLTIGDMLRLLRLELGCSKVPSHVPITSTCRSGIANCLPEIGAVS